MTERFTRILGNEASEKERTEFFYELSQHKELSEEFKTYLNLWNLASINCSKITLTKKLTLFETFWKNRYKKSKRIVLFSKFLKYAAVFLLVLVSYFVGNKLSDRFTAASSQYTLESSYGSISKFLLEDGSKIWLNSNSKITISEKGNVWTAKLDGEAFFDINHDKKRIFQVDLGDIIIRLSLIIRLNCLYLRKQTALWG